MATVFYLVRHAIKEKGIGDVAISSEGMLQAQATGRFLRDMEAAAIVSGPLLRTKQTAAVIARETNVSISEDSRLRERANWGDLPGESFEAFVEMWDRCTRERDYCPPVGDSSRQAGERLAACLSELAAEHPQDGVVVVDDGGLITDFLVHVMPEEELLKRHPNFIAEQSSLVAECSITKVSCREGRFQLEDFAAVVHLR